MDHPAYGSNGIDFDISILILAEDLTFDETITPVCLPYNDPQLEAGDPVSAL